MEKINIAELLKDCPKGMELDCTMFVNPVTLNNVVDDDEFPITIDTAKGCFVTLTKYGTYAEIEEAKCVIFPKGKTTWEGFIPPCKFKDGDILSYQCAGLRNRSIYIYRHHSTMNTSYYVALGDGSKFMVGNKEGNALNGYNTTARLATEEEKQKLFQAIKENGYNWNPETKTLEKLIEPKFKVGDRIKKDKDYISGIITNISDDGSYKVEYQGGGVSYVHPAYQNEWELVPNILDISTLVPFESRVLVRNADGDLWKPAIYGFSRSKGCYVVGGIFWRQCIPYEVNKELLGTTNDCDEYYKTWE